MHRDYCGNEYIDKYFSCHTTSDLNLSNCGKRILSLNHVYHYSPRNTFVLSLIREGKGILYSAERSYRVGEGTLMVFFPNSPEIHYRADQGTLFSVSWIGVFGSVVMNIISRLNITKERPLIQIQNPDALNDIMEEILSYEDNGTIVSHLHLIGKTYEYFSVLSREIQNNETKNYIEKAIEYMDASFTRGITSGDVAQYVKLDKSYFAMLFKRSAGISPSAHLKNVRIRRSLELLLNTNMSISEIATAVGIEDEHYFSRLFSSIVGESPSSYRKQYRKDNGNT